MASAEKAGSGVGPTVWTLLYFLVNLGITIHNKVVLATLGFRFPWLLTAVHSATTFMGAISLIPLGVFQPSNKLTTADQVTLAGFSVLYTVNIAVSNISLGMVSLPFHQIVRAMGPAVTVILELLVYGKSRSRRVYLTLVPVCLGVALSSAGDLEFTWMGAAMTVFGVILACWKQLVTNQLLVGPLKLHPLDLLWRMSLLSAIQCAAISQLNGETQRLTGYMDKLSSGGMPFDWSTFTFHMTTNAVLAFLINYVSFAAAAIIGPLAISVAANVKQVMVIILSIFMFGFRMTPLNAIGVPVTLLGGMLYSRESAAEKAAAAAGAPAAAKPAAVAEKAEARKSRQSSEVNPEKGS
ncbi:triose-phosphate transporter family-domain-containing protein [Hyaloraphidium curvatum]|nr:triose-phosphate transporter family-domain-containing protein [Hyaloraphidium curvatum]